MTIKILKVIAVMGLLSSILGLQGCKEKKADIPAKTGLSKKADTSKIYPYIITKDYLVDGTIVVDSIGHGLFTTLVHDRNGLVENVKQDELELMGLTAQQAFDKALQNLDFALGARLININKLNGPDGVPFILFSDHWLSASTLLATNIYSLSQTNLGTNTIYASIPHRDVLLLFPKCKGEKLENFKKMIKEKESNGRKPLTLGLFQLDNGKLTAIE